MHLGLFLDFLSYTIGLSLQRISATLLWAVLDVLGSGRHSPSEGFLPTVVDIMVYYIYYYLFKVLLSFNYYWLPQMENEYLALFHHHHLDSFFPVSLPLKILVV